MRLVFVVFIALATLFGAPAYNALREFHNGDGSSFFARANGNQHLNWLESEDGAILKFNEQTQNFDYAIIQNDQLLPSGRAYKKISNKEPLNADMKRSSRHQEITKERLQELFVRRIEASLRKKEHEKSLQ